MASTGDLMHLYTFYSFEYSQGSPLEEAKKILLMCLSHMKKDWMFNILVFGSSKFSIEMDI